MEKIRVMIADDHRLFGEGLRQLISTDPDLECVAMAADGKEALKLVQEQDIDVALLDIVMPEMNGIEAAKAIKAIRPKIAILILTAYQNEQYVISSVEAEVTGYLMKTSDPAELLNAIHMVHSGEGVFSYEATRNLIKQISSDIRRHPSERAILQRRQLEVLKLAAKGMTNREISEVLFISEATVNSHLVKIYRKLGVASRGGATLYALRKGWITMEELVESSED